MNTSQNIHVGLLSADPEMAAWLCDDVGCVPDENGQSCTFSSRQITFELANEEVSAQGAAQKFEVYVGIVRYVDVLSLKKMDDLLSNSGAGKKTPTLILIYRNENETDFKMSCPYCGQKLWVRDADQDKRGRCPHCSKGFTLPDQEEHVSSTLRLPPSVKVMKIIRQDPGSFAGPLREIIQLASLENSLHNLDQRSVINDTMEVKVEDDGSH